MNKPMTDLHQRIDSGGQILLAEITPPPQGDAAGVRQLAKRFAGKVHAVGVGDNRDRVGMAALAAAVVVAGEGVEPILHVNTRDRNRIALVSEALGARALGVRNILCTSGAHQTLGHFRAAKNVFDIDVVQLLQACANLATEASLVGEGPIAGADGFCLGAVASPHAEPLEMQMLRLGKKITAGARFLVSQPVYDVERFQAWWGEVTRRGIAEKVAIVAGVHLLGEAELAEAKAKGPRSQVPAAVLAAVGSKADAGARRRAAIDLAVETVKRLSATKGLRGFSIGIDGDHDAAEEILEKSALGKS